LLYKLVRNYGWETQREKLEGITDKNAIFMSIRVVLTFVNKTRTTQRHATEHCSTACNWHVPTISHIHNLFPSDPF
jgi:hypothetical protein